MSCWKKILLNSFYSFNAPKEQIIKRGNIHSNISKIGKKIYLSIFLIALHLEHFVVNFYLIIIKHVTVVNSEKNLHFKAFFAPPLINASEKFKFGNQRLLSEPYLYVKPEPFRLLLTEIATKLWIIRKLWLNLHYDG